MPIVCIQLFGAVSLFRGFHKNLDIPASCRPLLGYLCTHRNRRVPRQEIAGTLWGDFDDQRARRCLSTALWRLKSTPGLGIELLKSYGPGEIGLAPMRSIWIDTAAFERRATPWQGVAPERLNSIALHRLARAVAVYRGEFLPQVDDDWALLERQRLRTLYLDALYQLTAAYAHANDYARALTFGRRLSAIEPLREDVHRILMRAYVAMGNRGKAIEQYRICQGELGSELGIQPMAETQALFREIVDPDGPRAPTPAARLSAALGVANDHILWVRRTLRRSDERLAEALVMIERAGNTTP